MDDQTQRVVTPRARKRRLQNLLRRCWDRAPWPLRGVLLAVALIVAAGVLLKGWSQIPPPFLYPKSLTAAEAESWATEERRSLLAAAAGAVALATIYYTHQRHALERDANRTDRYSKAVEQLGSDVLAIRLGGIYALERVARDSPEDQKFVKEVLSAFVRMNRPREQDGEATWGLPRQDDQERIPAAPEDTVAAVTVLARARLGRGLDRDVLNLRGSYLAYADLTGVEGLAYVDLQGAELTGASLEGVNLRHSTLVMAHITEAQMSHANLEGAQLDGAQGNGVMLRQAKLDEATVSSATLRGADLEGSSLQRAVLNADFTDASLAGADLAAAKLNSAVLRGAVLSFARMPDSQLVMADLSGAVLTGATLQGADLARAKLVEANLTDVDLAKGDLTGADLRGANLSRTDLTGAHLMEADLSDALISGGNLGDATLTRADLRLAIVSRDQLSPVQLSDIVGEPEWRGENDGH